MTRLAAVKKANLHAELAGINSKSNGCFDDAEEELKRLEEFRKAQVEIEKKKEKPMTKRMFKAI